MTSASAPELIQFLLAEDVRLEQFGKLSLLGWYGGESITLLRSPGEPEQNWQPNLNSLAFIFRFTPGTGSYSAILTLHSPSGKEVGKANLGQVTSFNGQPLGVVCKVGPIQVSEFGTYTVGVQLDTYRYEKTFDLVRGGAAVEFGQRPLGVTATTPATKKRKAAVAKK